MTNFGDVISPVEAVDSSWSICSVAVGFNHRHVGKTDQDVWERMESAESPERGPRKLALSLWGEQQEGDGPGEGAGSSSRERGGFLEEAGLELGLSGVRLWNGSHSRQIGLSF